MTVEDVIGEAIADEILQMCTSEELKKFKKTIQFDEDEKNFPEEYFYLIMFLQTFASQVVFSSNKKIMEGILEAFHKHVFEKKFSLPSEYFEALVSEDRLRDRYTQYYKLSKDDENKVDFEFLINQLPYDFFANVFITDTISILNNEALRKKLIMLKINLSLWIGEMLKVFINGLSELKNKYKIKI
jgi:hypothetical protein